MLPVPMSVYDSHTVTSNRISNKDVPDSCPYVSQNVTLSQFCDKNGCRPVIKKWQKVICLQWERAKRAIGGEQF